MAGEKEIPVGDEDLENEIQDTEIELEVSDDEDDEETPVNPNVQDQLNESASDEGIKKELTAEEKLWAFIDANPDTRDIHGKDATKRIKKLTYEAKERERQAEEAINYARKIQEENEALKKRQVDQDGVFLTEHQTRLERELQNAKREYKEAYSMGDADMMADANQKIAVFGNQLLQAEQTSERFKNSRQRTEQPVAQPYAPQQQQPQQRPQQRPHTQTIDPKAEDWAGRNEWFGEDQELTEAALSIHRRLVTQEGYLPQSDAYYEELDTRIRRNFPSHRAFVKAGKPTMENHNTVVAPVANTGQPSRQGRKVKLTASQVSVAKKLGVPLAEYAKYVPRD